MSQDILSSDQVYSVAERETIAAIAGAMIGADDASGAPAASDPQILATIVEKAGQFSARLKPALAQFQADVDVSSTPSPELLARADKDRSISRVLTIVILQCYYQDPRVLAAFGLAARPPFPEGHEVESGDWSLLDPVKARKPFFRSA